MAECIGKDLHNYAKYLSAVYLLMPNSTHFLFSGTSFQISGIRTAYFPPEQDCLTTMSNSLLRRDVLLHFADDLKARGVDGEPQMCLVCGRT